MVLHRGPVDEMDSTWFNQTPVIVSAAAVGDPVEVRYGWAPEAETELWNTEGLPASPFRINVQ